MLKKKKVIIISILLLVLVAGFVLCYEYYNRALCAGYVKAIGINLVVYGFDYEDELPTADKWCDLLIQEVEMSPKAFVCPNKRGSSEKVSHYILNKNVFAYDPKTLPPGIVMVFEGPAGWNQIGGPEDLEAHHFGKYCTVGLTGGDIKSMTVSQAKQLNWGEKKSDGNIPKAESDWNTLPDKFVIHTYDGKCGTINSKGEVIIPPVYESMDTGWPYVGHTIAWTPECLIVFDEAGKEVDRLKGKWQKDNYCYVDEQLLFASDGIEGQIYDYRKNKTVFKCSDVFNITFEPYLEYVGVCVDGKWGFIKPSGEVAIDFQFEKIQNFIDDYALVRLNGKWGAIDSKGKIVMDCVYDKIKEIFWPDAPFYVAMTGKKYGLYDRQGNLFKNKYYDRVYSTIKNIYLYSESEGGMIIDLFGNEIMSGLDSFGADFNGFVVSNIGQDGEYHTDFQGNELYQERYFWVSCFQEGLAIAISTKGGLGGYIDKTGSFVIPPQFSAAGRFNDGLAKVQMPVDDKFIYGYINKQGKMVIKLAETEKGSTKRPYLGRFINGLASVELQDMKGYINTKGKWVWRDTKDSK